MDKVETALKKVFEKVLKYRQRTICKRLILCDLLSAMQDVGAEHSQGFAKCVVNAYDDLALEGLEYERITPQWDTPKINIRCEIKSEYGVSGTTRLNVVRVEMEDDGSFTAVTDYWPDFSKVK